MHSKRHPARQKYIGTVAVFKLLYLTRQVSVKEAKDTLKLWYRDRKEVLVWQKRQKELAHGKCEVYTLLGCPCRFPNPDHVRSSQRGHIEHAAVNAPVQVRPDDCG
jgi:DNA polymerase I-like protein with 3'-5' exonuclease and polymerase domains